LGGGFSRWFQLAPTQDNAGACSAPLNTLYFHVRQWDLTFGLFHPPPTQVVQIPWVIASSQPRIGGAGNAAKVYVPICKPKAPGSVGIDICKPFSPSGAVGIARIDNPTDAATPGVARADVGLGSLGTFTLSGAFVYQNPVLAADPFDADHVVAVDATAHDVKVSFDGGGNWDTDSELTRLVTNGGEFLFDLGTPDFTQAQTIAFDPSIAKRILVGTEAAGVVASSDGGLTWARVPGSSPATSVSSFHFDVEPAGDTTDRVVLSSYGRGLWGLVFPKTDLGVIATHAPEPVGVGQKLVFTGSVSNRGPRPATDVRLAVQLPPAFAYDSSAPACVVDDTLPSRPTVGQFLVCQIGDLDGGSGFGESRSFSIQVNVQFAPTSRLALTTFQATSPLAVELRLGDNRDLEISRIR